MQSRLQACLRVRHERRASRRRRSSASLDAVILHTQRRQHCFQLCPGGAGQCQRCASMGRSEHWRGKKGGRSRHRGSCATVQVSMREKGGPRALTANLTGPARALQRHSPGRSFCVSALHPKDQPPGLQCTATCQPSRLQPL